MLRVVAAAALVGGVLSACSSSNGTGPGGGNVPDLAGTWNLVSLDIGATGQPLTPPEATGTFSFTADSVTVDLAIASPPAPAPIAIQGKGSYALTPTTISINSNALLLGQASGSYTYVARPSAGVADTLKASLVSQGTPIDVVVVRP
ncbi:MAG TPA: lipocalin family protein [Gemmatimonadales bacterium]|nr:lipocalin family protein [Gemmatimonadales bacterium]